jgi:hypothetical protein
MNQISNAQKQDALIHIICTLKQKSSYCWPALWKDFMCSNKTLQSSSIAKQGPAFSLQKKTNHAEAAK